MYLNYPINLYVVGKGYEYSHVLKYRFVDLSPISRKTGLNIAEQKLKTWKKILTLKIFKGKGS